MEPFTNRCLCFPFPKTHTCWSATVPPIPPPPPPILSPFPSHRTWFLLPPLLKSTRCLMGICFPCWLVGVRQGTAVGVSSNFFGSQLLRNIQLIGYLQESHSLLLLSTLGRDGLLGFNRVIEPPH